MISASRILAICPIGIGNFLLLLPALQHLKEKNPDADITLLSLKPAIADLAKRYSFIRETVSIDASKTQSFFNKIDLLKRLFRKFDVSISFFPSNRLEYNLVPFLACVKKRIGFHYTAHRMKTLSFLNNASATVSDFHHDLIQNFSALRLLDLAPPLEMDMVAFPLTDEEKDYAKRFLQDNNLRDRTLIGLHPGSSSEHGMGKKRWPVQHFAKLAALIQQDREAAFLVFGGPEEESLKEGLARQIGPACIPVKTGSLFKTAAIIGACHRFISNDSGLMHVAVALKVKTAGIFGPTDDTRTAPFGNSHLVVRGNFDCAPCWTIKNVGKRECCGYGNFRCLNDLGPATVYKRIANWL